MLPPVLQIEVSRLSATVSSSTTKENFSAYPPGNQSPKKDCSSSPHTPPNPKPKPPSPVSSTLSPLTSLIARETPTNRLHPPQHQAHDHWLKSLSSESSKLLVLPAQFVTAGKSINRGEAALGPILEAGDQRDEVDAILERKRMVLELLEDEGSTDFVKQEFGDADRSGRVLEKTEDGGYWREDVWGRQVVCGKDRVREYTEVRLQEKREDALLEDH